MEAYTEFARIYDTFMEEIEYDAWADRLIRILRDAGIDDGLVCDLGCGTGEITERLAAAGYDMIGIDVSAEMLAVAQEKKKHDILYLQQDAREFELYGTVRAIVSTCDSLNYITEPEELAEVFRLANNYLDPGGLFLFDLNTSRKYEKIGEDVIAENRPEGSFIWENVYDPATRLNEYLLTLFLPDVMPDAGNCGVMPDAGNCGAMPDAGNCGATPDVGNGDEKPDVITCGETDDARLQAEDGPEGQEEDNLGEIREIRYRKIEELHLQRAYDQEEIRALIAQAGMEWVGAYDDYTGEPAKSDSERILYVAREHGKV